MLCGLINESITIASVALEAKQNIIWVKLTIKLIFVKAIKVGEVKSLELTRWNDQKLCS